MAVWHSVTQQCFVAIRYGGDGKTVKHRDGADGAEEDDVGTTREPEGP
jgi:hypothetical protein